MCSIFGRIGWLILFTWNSFVRTWIGRMNDSGYFADHNPFDFEGSFQRYLTAVGHTVTAANDDGSLNAK